MRWLVGDLARVSTDLTPEFEVTCEPVDCTSQMTSFPINSGVFNVRYGPIESAIAIEPIYLT